MVFVSGWKLGRFEVGDSKALNIFRSGLSFEKRAQPCEGGHCF